MTTAPHLPAAAEVPERTPLGQPRVGVSPLLARVLARDTGRGPGRVAVAAFQSAV